MINGILLIDKPEGLSSARVVDRVKRALKVKKAGHTGTLDPFATGLLPVALGKATRLSRFFLGGRKKYRATVRLGIETDTYDKTGQAVSEADPELVSAVMPEQVAQVVASFAGVQEQVAPAYSALKHKGQPLYKLARQGQMVQKPPRQIEIYDIRVTTMNLPEFKIDVSCSAGTYIRSLAYDMGKLLGCGAHLSGLRRTGVSHFTLDRAIDLPMFEDQVTTDKAAALGHVIPMADCLPSIPAATAGPAAARKIRHGQKLAFADLEREAQTPGIEFIRVMDEDRQLLAIVTPGENGQNYNYCCVFSG